MRKTRNLVLPAVGNQLADTTYCYYAGGRADSFLWAAWRDISSERKNCSSEGRVCDLRACGIMMLGRSATHGASSRPPSLSLGALSLSTPRRRRRRRRRRRTVLFYTFPAPLPLPSLPEAFLDPLSLRSSLEALRQE